MRAFIDIFSVLLLNLNQATHLYTTVCIKIDVITDGRNETSVLRRLLGAFSFVLFSSL